MVTKMVGTVCVVERGKDQIPTGLTQEREKRGCQNKGNLVGLTNYLLTSV